MKNAKCVSCRESNFRVMDVESETLVCHDCVRTGKAAARIAELETALANLEYVYHPYVSAANKRRCPVCGTPEGRGHEFDSDCWLGALLEKVRP